MLKKLIWLTVALVTLAGVGYGGRKGYKIWRHERLLEQARYYISKGDGSNAYLCLQKAVASNPTDPQACKLFAGLAELARNPNVIYWRRRVAELSPGSVEARLEWAQSALAYGELKSANEALSQIPESSRNGAEYHKMVAALAWSLRQIPEAESHYLEALKLEPDNLTSLFNLATVQLASGDPAKETRGHESLVQLATNAPVRCQALRELTVDCIRLKAWPKAKEYATALVTETKSTFQDRIFRLQVLVASKDPSLSALLSATQQDAAREPRDAAALGEWMLESGRKAEANAWLSQLPAAFRTNLPVAAVLTEAKAQGKGWSEIQSAIRGQSWPGSEHVRLAQLARALKAEGNALAAGSEWRRAMKACANRQEALSELGKRVAAWGWEPEKDEILWALFTLNPKDTAPFTALYARLYAAGNTRALQSLLSQTAHAAPENADINNNLAILSLLINPTDMKGHSLARDVHTKDPKNPYYASTYAYSLHLQRKTSEALKILEGLGAEQLSKPAVSVYYGVVLAAAGDRGKARQVLASAEKAKMLPEERALIERARSGI